MSIAGTVLILFGGLLLLLFLNLPIVVAIGLPTIIVMFVNGYDVSVYAQRLFASVDSFSLLAIPFFMLAGSEMEVGGMSRRIVNLSNSLIGWVVGGLGHVIVVSCAFFGALSGSAAATTAAIGSVLIPEMTKKGYPREFSSGIVSVSGFLGIIIPPSIPMIIYGVSSGTSIGDLFVGGIIPGILIALALMFIVRLQAKKIDIPKPEHSSNKEILHSFIDAIPAILVPVIIIGGIYGGIFTPTEAGAVAALYGLIIGLFFYKEINMKNIKDVFGGAITNTILVMLMIAVSGAFSWVLTIEGVAKLVGNFIYSISSNRYVFLILVNLLLLFMGCFFETCAAILIVTPILYPIAMDFGIDPVHFGIVICFNLGMGLSTPPVGENQYIAASISGIPFEKQVRASIPYLIASFACLIITTYIPLVVTWLPSLLK